jgi:general secretion pathway protein E
LHTNDAPSAVTRLADMGIEPFLISSSLLGVLAQRLVRRLCTHCKRQDAQGAWHPVGCEHCSHAGYSGRTGIYELLEVDDTMRELIHNRAQEAELRQAADKQGMKSLREDGERYVSAGITSAEELLRVTRD